MTRHVMLKTPCPLCQGRLDAAVRRMPLLGWHMVGLACEHGCDIRWFNGDIDFSRSGYPTAESCVEYVDTLLSTECPKCGERPQMGLRHRRVLAMSGTLKRNDTAVTTACARGRIDPYGTSTRPRGVFGHLPRSRQREEWRARFENPSRRDLFCVPYRRQHVRTRFWIYSLSFLVSRQREGRRADST